MVNIPIGAGWGFAVGFGLGTANNPLDIKGNIINGIVGVTLTRPLVLNKLVTPAIQTVGGDLWTMAKAFTGTTTGAAVTGYVAGAAIGTGIVTAVWGWDPEGPTMGGKDVLGFYTLGAAGPAPTLESLKNVYEYAPRTKPGKYLQYYPNITWLWGKENIAYI